jgi:hypothetical protein
MVRLDCASVLEVDACDFGIALKVRDVETNALGAQSANLCIQLSFCVDDAMVGGRRKFGVQ